MSNFRLPMWHKANEFDLPNENEDVLVRVEDRITNVAYRKDDKWYTFDGDGYSREIEGNVTYWIVMPEEPICYYDSDYDMDESGLGLKFRVKE